MEQYETLGAGRLTTGTAAGGIEAGIGAIDMAAIGTAAMAAALAGLCQHGAVHGGRGSWLSHWRMVVHDRYGDRDSRGGGSGGGSWDRPAGGPRRDERMWPAMPCSGSGSLLTVGFCFESLEPEVRRRRIRDGLVGGARRLFHQPRP
jgi:hypothetical protein